MTKQFRLYFLISALVLIAVPTRVIYAVSMQILPDDALSKNVNFRQADTFGFSVVYTPQIYGVYGNHVAFRRRWNSQNPTFMEDLFFPTTSEPDVCGSPNGSSNSPDMWDQRCIDSVGYIWKSTNCTNTTSACANNDLWNAYPGMSNLQTFASATTEPIWPRVNAWGVLNFAAVINKNTINSAISAPPLTGNESTCHPNNPRSLATGAANSKVVQVYYADGSSRWYMAFNEQIHDSSVLDTQGGLFGEDNWRILWATSKDGLSWVVDPQILFRSVSEADKKFCGGGLLVTDMLLDDGFFYMTFTDVGSDHLYLVRSPINANPQALIGYTEWSIAQPPLVGDKSNSYQWQPIALGMQQDFALQHAANILPSRNAQYGFGFGVKVAAVTRYFQSAAAGSGSSYIAVTNDVENGCNPTSNPQMPSAPCPQVLQLWSTSQLTQPMVFQGVIDTSGVSKGSNGWEFGFTHYADNLVTSPRVIASAFDFWVVQSLQNPNATFADTTPGTTLTRKTAQISQ